jgi:hypothetical protein
MMMQMLEMMVKTILKNPLQKLHLKLKQLILTTALNHTNHMLILFMIQACTLANQYFLSTEDNDDTEIKTEATKTKNMKFF